jgi:hypothetical protein
MDKYSYLIHLITHPTDNDNDDKRETSYYNTTYGIHFFITILIKTILPNKNPITVTI